MRANKKGVRVNTKGFKKAVKWFRSQFPEWASLSDTECFAFCCLMKETWKRSLYTPPTISDITSNTI